MTSQSKLSGNSGRPFLQIPGPTLVPERIVRAMSRSLIDHRGPDFAALLNDVIEGLKGVFKTAKGRIVVFPGSGTAAWEGCIVNTLSPGDRVLGCVNGHFSSLFCRTAESFGVQVEALEFPYGAGVSGARVEERLQHDVKHNIKAVLVVHNETSTGVTSDIPAIRHALDRARHPALLLVDSVSSVASIEFRLDDWRVDVALAGAQHGPILERNRLGEVPSTPATAHFFGLKESLAMLGEEGLPNVFRRHARLAESCRCAVQAMGLRLLAGNPAEYSNTLTAVCMPEGFDADAFVAHAYKRLNFSLGIGLDRKS